VRRRFAKGEVIFHEGDPGDAVHLVDKGKVAVRIATPLGEVTTLSVRGPGDFVGELGFIHPDELRSASLVCLSPVETLVLRRGEMDRLVTEHPQVLWAIIERLAERVRVLSALVLESRYDAADVRVRRRLLEFSYEDRENAVIAVTQEELAWLAGSTRGTVNRVLAEEAKRGTLTTARGRITVLNRDDLARRAK
jgi:CRP-like cAMP-binding protein